MPRKKTCGVYKITNLLTEDFYIGSSIEMECRWNNHKSCAGIYRDERNNRISYLYRAMQKYGVDNFIFQIVEECALESLRDREQYYIDTLKPKYNVSLVATGGGGLWTEERKVEYSQRRKAEVAAGINVPPIANRGNKDFRHSEDSKELMRQSVKEARERIIKERGSYLTPEGLENKNAKIQASLTPERRDRYSKETAAALKIAKKQQKDLADGFAKKYLRLIERMQGEGLNLSQIAFKLTAEGHTSRRGGIWTDQTVRQILKRTNRHVPSKDNRVAENIRKQKADAFAKSYIDLIQKMKDDGLNLSEIAKRLNADGHKSRRGAVWTYHNVGQLLKRKIEELPRPPIKARDLSSEVIGARTNRIMQKDVKVDTGKRFIGWDRKN